MRRLTSFLLERILLIEKVWVYTFKGMLHVKISSTNTRYTLWGHIK